MLSDMDYNLDCLADAVKTVCSVSEVTQQSFHWSSASGKMLAFVPSSASLTVRPRAAAGGGGVPCSRFPPLLRAALRWEDSSLCPCAVPALRCQPHTRHDAVAGVRGDDPTDIDGCAPSVPLKRLLALRGGFNPLALANKYGTKAVSVFIKPAVEEYFSESNFVSELKRLIRHGFLTLGGGVGLTLGGLWRLSKTIAPLTEEAQERRLEGCPLPVIVEDPGDPKKLIVEVRVPKHLRGLGEKAFRLESPEEELGRKIRLAVGVDGVSKTWTLQLPLAKRLNPTITSKLIWLVRIDGASQSKFRRCRLEVI